MVEGERARRVQFVSETVVLRKSATELSGYFTKSGDSTVQMKNVTLPFNAKDCKKQIWSDKGRFEDVDISVRPGERTPHTFVVENPSAPAYDAPFSFGYNLND